MNRSTDTAKINQASRGSLRLWLVLALLTAAACGIAAALLYTISEAKRLLALGALPEAAALAPRQQWLTAALLAVCLLDALAVWRMVLAPVRGYVAQIRGKQALTMRGAYELRYLAASYNLVVDETRKHNDSLRYLAEHDPLTGLLNRGAFDKLRRELAQGSIALLLIDVDKFKEVNDGWGHETGDLVLQRVAWLLSSSFRTSDYPCRIGGDEFAVIMENMDPSLRSAVLNKISQLNKGLAEGPEELPRVTLSIGVAFSAQCGPRDDIFRLADAALYRVKSLGRNGCAFYDPAEDGETVRKSTEP